MHFNEKLVSKLIQLIGFLFREVELLAVRFETVLRVNFHPTGETEEDLLNGHAWVVTIVPITVLGSLNVGFIAA